MSKDLEAEGGNPTLGSSIVILHFNDVYELEERQYEQTDGTVVTPSAARFVTAIEQRRPSADLVLFSGDLFSPSQLAAFFRGEQMIDVFNRLKVDVSCLGNHETDFGLARMRELIQATNSPWLMANCFEEPGRTIGDLPGSHILYVKGMKVGFIGLCEPDWLETINPYYVPEELIFTDFVIAANEMCDKLLLEERPPCDFIIALTHMRLPNDRILAKQCPRIDLILGGHDHCSIHERIDKVTIVKSGTDFEEFSQVSIDVHSREIAREKVLITEAFAPDPQILSHIRSYAAEVDKKLDQACGFIDTDLEGRFEIIRTRESSMGNFIADLLSTQFDDVDVVLVNCGTLRANCVHPRGYVTLKQLAQILPVPDKVVQLALPGRIILAALENAVCKYPSLEGRFCAISGIDFVWDSSRESGQRVISTRLWKTNAPVKPETQYNLVCKSFLSQGRDGFACLTDPAVKILTDNDAALVLMDIVYQFFEQLGPGAQPITDKKRAALWQRRLQLMNTDENNRCERGYIKIAPTLTGRIKNISE